MDHPVVPSSSTQLQQSARLERSLNTAANSRQPSSSTVRNQGSALRPNTSPLLDSSADSAVFPPHTMSNVEDSPGGEDTFAASLLQFDPTNWLLDETFVDLGGMDFLWNDASNTYDATHSNSSSVSMTSPACNPPAVLDLQQLWYNQVPNTVEELYCKPERSGRQAIDPQRRDIDEMYRTNMAEELSRSLRNEPLPTIDFLVPDSETPLAGHFR